MNTNKTWTTDNRWSPGASGATVPDNAPAAYSARWIDMGDNVPADVVPDRQGFAYNSIEDREDLIELLNKAGNHTRTPAMANMVRDMTCVVFNHPEWKMYVRRAGGYVYVDAWLCPPGFDFVTTDHGSGVTYTPWTDGYAVGFKIEHPDGRSEYLWLNPSQTEPDTDDDTPCLFIYHDETPEGLHTVCYVNVVEAD